MTKTSKTIVFFGSGPVAAKSLKLLSDSFSFEAIITKPSTESEMKNISDDTPVYAVSTRKELDDLFAKQKFESSLAVLIDFGIIISRSVIDYFDLGIINSHFSILPEWRGADPISAAILSGQKNTGVSLMLLTEKMDEGKLLAYAELDIKEHSTTPSLTDELIDLSNKLLNENIPKYLQGKLKAMSQSVTNRKVSYSRKLTKEDGIIDWQKPAHQIEREIRAYIDWPKSRTKIAGKDVIITEAHAVPSNNPSKKPGDIEVIKDDGINVLMIDSSDGYLCIDKLKPAGKSEMSVQAFIAGYGNKL